MSERASPCPAPSSARTSSVTHAAITQNKRLRAALAYIKEEQEKSAATKDQTRQLEEQPQKRQARRPPVRPSKVKAYYERRRAERAAPAG